MSPLQKFAWLSVTVNGVALVGFLASLPFMGQAAQAWFAFMALGALGAFILRNRRGKVVMDERDRQIWGISLGAGYSVFWVAFVAGCMVPQHIYGWDGSMPVRLLQLYLPLGWCLVWGTQAVVILVMYARAEARHEQE